MHRCNMKKILHSKTGFTLVETILVIAIIVIIASIIIIASASYLSKANIAKSKVESYNLVLSSENAVIDANV